MLNSLLYRVPAYRAEREPGRGFALSLPPRAKRRPSPVACHEAAHAVAAIACGATVERVSLTADGGGYCRSTPLPARLQSLVAAAGAIGESAFGYDSHGSASGADESRFSGEPADVDRAAALVHANREAIELLAFALDARTSLNADGVADVLGLPRVRRPSPAVLSPPRPVSVSRKGIF